MLRIYHNPRCSKSRAALTCLQEAGLEPEVINYLNAPPQRTQLLDLIAKLDTPASALLRDTPQAASMTDQAIIDALLADPKLLQRPLIEADTCAIIGRPTERVAAFIQEMASD